MSQPKNAMEIFKLLEKSNCRECGEKTCLAFASAVYQSRKKLSLCTRLDSDIIEKYSGEESDKNHMSVQMGDQRLEALKKRLLQIDFEKSAQRSGADFDGKAIKLKILGKTMKITPDARFKTDIHANPFITGPILDYIINGKGFAPLNDWISFRELQNSDDLMYSFFQKRCENALKRVADQYTDLFDDLVDIFGGRRVEAQFQADISVVLHPLPKVPIMICYLKPEEGMPSTLNLFFDRTVNDNLSIDSVLAICNGFAAMIEKITEKHGVIAV